MKASKHKTEKPERAYLEFSESHYPWDSKVCFFEDPSNYYNVSMKGFKNFNFKNIDTCNLVPILDKVCFSAS